LARPFSRLLAQLSSRLIGAEDPLEVPPAPDFHDVVEQARTDWLTARAYFESVSDPDLVDHAIYLIEAAEKKYMYLLKQARPQQEQPGGAA